MRQFCLFPVLFLLCGGLVTAFAQVAGVQAPGAPIFDCAGDTATINRLSAGLPVQEEALRRSEAALDAARIDAMKDSADARDKWTLEAIKMLNSQARNIANSSETLLAHEEGLKSHGIPVDVARRFKFLQSMKRISELSDKLVDSTKPVEGFQAGNAFGNRVFVQKSANDLIAQIEETRKLFVDSGIAEEMGAKLSEVMWGPIGEAGFKGVVTGLDLLTASLQAVDSVAVADQAERNLEVLRSQYQRIQDRIYELKQEVSEGCANAQPKQNAASDETTPPPASQPPTATPPPTKPDATPVPPAGGDDTLWMVGGLAAAGVIAGGAYYYEMNKQNSSGQCDGLSPVNACGSCTSNSQCGGGGCFTSVHPAPFCH